MQAPMHFLVAILIFNAVPNPILGFFLVFLSHYLVDILALLTYHPKDPLPQDKFWVRYHIFILILTIVMVIFFIKAYFWVMIVSLLPDIIDWVIMRMILKKDAIIHPLIDRIRVSKVFSWIPDLNLKPIGALYEGIALSLLFVLYFVFYF